MHTAILYIIIVSIGKVSSPTILKNDIGWSDFTRVEKHERIDNDTALVSINGA